MFFITSSGSLESSDAQIRWDTAKSWIEGNKGALNQYYSTAPDPSSAVNAAGKIYSGYGLLQSVLMAPVVLLSRGLAKSKTSQENIGKFIFSTFIIPLIAALTMLFVFISLREFGFSLVVVMRGAIAVGLGTILWHYFRSGQEESLLALGFSVWLLGISLYSPVLIVISFSVLFLTKWSMVLMIFILMVISFVHLFKNRDKWQLKWLVCSIVMGAVVVSIVLIHNYLRFSDPFETGYALGFRQAGYPALFSFDGYLDHLMALLVSPYRGYFLYSPILILCFLPIRMRAPASVKPTVIAAFLVFIVSILFFSAYIAWGAGFGWGPRFLASGIILFAPLLTARLKTAHWAWLLLLVSIVVQINSILLPGNTEEIWHLANEKPVNKWSFEQNGIFHRLPLNYFALKNTLSGEVGRVTFERTFSPVSILETSDYRSLYWWSFRLAYRFKLFSPMLAWGICIVGLGGAFVVFWLAWRLARVESAKSKYVNFSKVTVT